MKKLGIGILTLTVIAGIYFGYPSQRSAADPMESSQGILPVGSSPSITASTVSKDRKEPTTAAELEKLSVIIRDETGNQEERRKALYTLTQMGARALPALTQLATSTVPDAKSQDPHSVDQLKQSYEIGLRVTAIEALDELSSDSQLSQSVATSMMEVLKVQKHKSLTLLAQISLSGIESGRPGKVKRAIDALLKEKE